VRIAPSLRLSDESLPLQALHSDIRHPDAVGTGNAVRHFQYRESKGFQKRQIDRHHRLHLWESGQCFAFEHHHGKSTKCRVFDLDGRMIDWPMKDRDVFTIEKMWCGGMALGIVRLHL
jgi:hypothetical protein